MLEICCGSYYDVKQARDGGAKRVELNQALALGGLTPSYASYTLSRELADMEIIVMIRPRAGGFNYHEDDLKVMFEDAKWFLDHGVDGLAFGFLDEFNHIDIKNTKLMCDLIHQYHKCAVFHRAFDVCDNMDESIRQLIDIGIDRILTSGQAQSVIEGIDTLKYLQATYGSQIQILAGCGVKIDNINQLQAVTKIKQFHCSAKGWLNDFTSNNHGVSYDYDNNHLNQYEVVCGDIVASLIDKMK